MNQRHFFKLLLPLAIVAVVLIAFAQGDEPKEPMGGKVYYKGNNYTVFIANHQRHEVEMHWKDADGKRFGTMGKVLDYQQKRGKKVLMITNGGMFEPSHSPKGAFVQNARTLVPTDTCSGKGNFYIKPNGVFVFNEIPILMSTPDFEKIRSTADFHYATQSGPMLVYGDTINPVFQPNSTNKYIRSGVGINNKGEAVFAISSQPVNFYDFATLFKDGYRCKWALYLDGAISKMYYPPYSNDLGGDFGPIISVIEK